MSWQPIKIHSNAPSVGTGIKVALTKRASGAAKLSITVTGSAVKELGWSNGDKLEVMMGEKEHHGLMRLRHNNSVGTAVVEKKSAVRGGVYQRVRLGEQSAFVGRAEKAQWVKWEKVEDGWVEIVLPKWADETAPSRRKPAEIPLSNEPAKAPPRPTQNVTRELMGDPPPERSALMDRLAKVKTSDFK